MNVLSEKQGFVQLITINRPDKLNALNKATIQELHDTLQKAEQDSQIRVVILTGSGQKAFVAGADIAEFANFSAQEGALLARKGQELLFDFVQNMSTPVIAAVNGFALGGGLELAMSAHIRVASTNAKMGLPEVSLGVIPGYGGTQRLAQLIGRGRAFELIMTASMIDATSAYNFGLVNHVVEQDKLIDFAMELAGKISKNSPTAIGKAIQAVNANYQYDSDGFEKEIQLFGECFATQDFKEGTTAFLEKRKPEFKGL